MKPRSKYILLFMLKKQLLLNSNSVIKVSYEHYLNIKLYNKDKMGIIYVYMNVCKCVCNHVYM